MWVIWALTSAVLESFSSLFRKQATIGRRDYSLIPILSIAFALPVTTALAIYSFLNDEIGSISTVAVILVINIMLNSAAQWARYRAIKIGDLSFVDPLTMLTPALSILTAWVMLVESPPPYGILGVVLIAFGALYLASPKRGIGAKKSLRLIVNNRATMFAVAAIMIWSISINLDKIITEQIPVLLYVWILHLGMLSALSLAYRPSALDLKKLAKNKGALIVGLGVAGSLALVFQIMAVNSTYVSYAIALRRLDVLITVFFGAFILKERGFRKRIIGAAVMLVGFLVLSIQ